MSCQHPKVLYFEKRNAHSLNVLWDRNIISLAPLFSPQNVLHEMREVEESRVGITRGLPTIIHAAENPRHPFLVYITEDSKRISNHRSRVRQWRRLCFNNASGAPVCLTPQSIVLTISPVQVQVSTNPETHNPPDPSDPA